MDSFGTISLDGRNWKIQCAPHVSTKLKRVFPRAPQQAAEAIYILNTPENSRDIEWFLQRYPMTCIDQGELVLRANEHRQIETRLEDLRLKRFDVPRVALAKPPRDYQEVVPALLDIKKGLLLADDVGVGKTISGFCCMTLPEVVPIVVVVPAHLPRHWAEKLTEFLPALRVHIIKKTQPYDLTKKPRGRQGDLLDQQSPDVIVISYHKLRGWAETLAGYARLVIFDECQQLRRPTSEIYQACKLLASKSTRRLGLSATPIYNYGEEFFWVIDCLLPDALGDRSEFMREWIGVDNFKEPEAFGAYVRREGIMLRRTRRDVNRELPALQKIVHTIDADIDVLDKLQGDAIELARRVVAANERFRGDRMQAAGEFDNLMRQATGIAKAPYVAEFVKLLLESGESVVLFGWHREVYRIWQERLRDFDPTMYTGTESQHQKAIAEKRFKDGASPLLLMSLRSGAGVDGLQHVCRTAVFGELDWSPGVHEQCYGRLDRDGQLDPVTAFFMVSEHGADPVMADVLGIKREQIEGVRNPGGELIERVETGEAHIRRLAREFLERRGLAA